MAAPARHRECGADLTPTRCLGAATGAEVRGTGHGRTLQDDAGLARESPQSHYDVARPSLEVEAPDNYGIVIDLLELATVDKTTDRVNYSYVVYRDRPTTEDLKKAGKERRQREAEEERFQDEQTRRAHAAAGDRRSKEEYWGWNYEPFRQAINDHSREDAGKKALKRFGLKLPCTADDVNHAFRAIVKAEKPHPDQGGSDEAMRELIELKEEALRYVEENSTTYARTG